MWRDFLLRLARSKSAAASEGQEPSRITRSPATLSRCNSLSIRQRNGDDTGAARDANLQHRWLASSSSSGDSTDQQSESQVTVSSYQI